MEIKKTATAGTLESSDAYVVAGPFDTLEVDLTSVVYELRTPYPLPKRIPQGFW